MGEDSRGARAWGAAEGVAAVTPPTLPPLRDKTKRRMGQRASAAPAAPSVVGSRCIVSRGSPAEAVCRPRHCSGACTARAGAGAPGPPPTGGGGLDAASGVAAALVDALNGAGGGWQRPHRWSLCPLLGSTAAGIPKAGASASAPAAPHAAASAGGREVAAAGVDAGAAARVFVAVTVGTGGGGGVGGGGVVGGCARDALPPSPSSHLATVFQDLWAPGYGGTDDPHTDQLLLNC